MDHGLGAGGEGLAIAGKTAVYLDRRPISQPVKVELCDAFDAILYVNRMRIPWKYLSHDFPNHGTVYAYYAAWRDEGVFARHRPAAVWVI